MVKIHSAVLRLASCSILVALMPAAAGAGTIVGKVVLEGNVQRAGKTATDADELIRAQRALVVSDRNRIANVVVSIKGITANFAPRSEPPTINQKEKTFVPHVLPILRGEKVEFINSDQILHNIHAYDGDRTLFNTAMPLQHQRFPLNIKAEGDVVMVKCDVHKHMRAWIVIHDNPYFSVTNESGLFSIEDVPAGTYTIRAWHEVLGTMEQEVTVKEGDEKTPVIFTFRAE